MRNYGKTWRAALLAALAYAAAAQVPAAENPASSLLGSPRTLLGTSAPTVKLTTIDGATIDLAALRGSKAVYLKFWATWCGPCRAQMPHFENVYQHAGDDLQVVAINAGFNDTLEDIRDYREELGIHMPIAVDDGMLAGAFNLRITPQHIVIGKDGLIKHIGNMADAELDAALERESHAPDVPASSVAASLAPIPRLRAGDLLPAAVVTAGGKDVALVDATERGTVMVFMTPWCESYLATTRPEQVTACREVREQVEALKRQYPELRWLGVASGIWTLAPDLVAYAQQNKVTLPLALDADGALFRRFGVMRVPTIVVADANGRIVERVEGYAPALTATLAALQSH
jgi:thiol-disulfide isomerase/thioredoxin